MKAKSFIIIYSVATSIIVMGAIIFLYTLGCGLFKKNTSVSVNINLDAAATVSVDTVSCALRMYVEDDLSMSIEYIFTEPIENDSMRSIILFRGPEMKQNAAIFRENVKSRGKEIFEKSYFFEQVVDVELK